MYHGIYLCTTEYLHCACCRRGDPAAFLLTLNGLTASRIFLHTSVCPGFVRETIVRGTGGFKCSQMHSSSGRGE